MTEEERPLIEQAAQTRDSLRSLAETIEGWARDMGAVTPDGVPAHPFDDRAALLMLAAALDSHAFGLTDAIRAERDDPVPTCTCTGSGHCAGCQSEHWQQGDECGHCGSPWECVHSDELEPGTPPSECPRCVNDDEDEDTGPYCWCGHTGAKHTTDSNVNDGAVTCESCLWDDEQNGDDGNVANPRHDFAAAA